MFRFEDSTYLWLLLIIPLLIVLYFVKARKRARQLRRFGNPELLRQLSPDYSKARPRLKFWLLIACLTLLIIIIARPQMGMQTSGEKRSGIETIIAMDISNSMLAQDVAPSRLDKSKMMVENLIDRLSNDKIGLVVFAGDAFVQLPITSDYVSAKMFLDNIDPSLIGTQGTDIGRAIDVAMHSFTQDDNTGKAIIVITDGEDHEGNAEEMAQKARRQGINVFILGIGSTKGAPIPLPGGGYMQDSKGAMVISRLNESMCRQIAQAGDGTYLHVDNSSVAEMRLNNELSKLQKGDISTSSYNDYAEQFQAFAIILLILLIVETLIADVQNKTVSNWKLFKRKV